MDTTYTAVDVTPAGDRRRATLSLDRAANPDQVGRVPAEIILDLIDGDLPDLVAGSTVTVHIALTVA